MSLTFANKLTIGRILSVPFFIACLMYYTLEHDYLRYCALGIFLLAIVTDVVDGYVARVHHQKTTAGAILDPLADKFLLISAFICLHVVKEITVYPSYVPMAVLIVVISRDVILLLGSTIIYLVHGKIDIIPTKWGKATTFFQVVSIVGILLRLPIFPMAWYIVCFVTISSGLGYIRNGVKVLNATAH
ncbi:MAG: CDP-alcohol phosphatidyltransferase family protein [Candidatus Omnitrophica bacterium]|nr:CDP-alcohol phosphatidyltransferase family protein [Candidatus Omnitrophota bacterium]